MNKYKLMPPPNKLKKTRENKCKIGEQDNLTEINANDEYCLLIQNIQFGYRNGDFQLFNAKLENVCEYLSDKKIPQKIPYFEEYDIFIILFDVCKIQEIYENIISADLVFNLMYILTKNQEFQNIIPINFLTEFLDVSIIYTESNWYFKLLSNYVLQPTYFMPFSIEPILNFISDINDREKILNILKFLEELSKFKFLSKDDEINEEINDEIDDDYLYCLSRNILLIVGYCAESVHSKPKNPIILSISVILERLTKNKHLDIPTFKSKDFPHFIDQNFFYYPKFIKMISYYVYNYGELDFDFLRIANYAIDDNMKPNDHKYPFWTLYNMIKIDENCIFKYDSEEFNAVDQICLYVYEMMDELQYSIKRQAALLIALMYSVVPIEVIRDLDILEKTLQILLLFCEEEEDTEMIDIIFNALENIYYLLQNSRDFISSESKVIDLFNQCRESLKNVYFNINIQNYEILHDMVIDFI